MPTAPPKKPVLARLLAKVSATKASLMGSGKSGDKNSLPSGIKIPPAPAPSHTPKPQAKKIKTSATKVSVTKANVIKAGKNGGKNGLPSGIKIPPIPTPSPTPMPQIKTRTGKK